jgi:hypothetical protein
MVIRLQGKIGLLRICLAGVVLACSVSGCRPEPVTIDPATGFHFPPASEIESVTVIGLPFAAGARFKAPPETWNDIFASLSPSGRDPDPLKWAILADLEIIMKDKRTLRIAIWDLRDSEIGAFKAGEYYRGGNTQRVKDALYKAFAEYNRQKAAESAEGKEKPFPKQSATSTGKSGG